MRAAHVLTGGATRVLRRLFPVIDAITGVACWWCGHPERHDDDTGCGHPGCGCTDLI